MTIEEMGDPAKLADPAFAQAAVEEATLYLEECMDEERPRVLKLLAPFLALEELWMQHGDPRDVVRLRKLLGE
jgi:hypothetical protein